jgi:hypothetical protein
MSMTTAILADHAWIISVKDKITEVVLTTGNDKAQAQRQAEAKKTQIEKQHSAGAVRMSGPHKVTRA